MIVGANGELAGVGRGNGRCGRGCVVEVLGSDSRQGLQHRSFQACFLCLRGNVVSGET